MIIHREALVILAILGSAFTFHCPTNEACICNSKRVGELTIVCLMKNDTSSFIVHTYKHFIQITCRNSPEWSDFHLDILSSTQEIKSIVFHKCNLPTNNNLNEIIRTLKVIGVERLFFRSYMNLNSVLFKHHLNSFENLKHLTLQNNNMSYIDKDLLAGLNNLTELDLSDNNLLQLDAKFFDYTPGLQWLQIDKNALQSIELGTFNNLKNLTLLDLQQNHLIEFQSGIFDELIALKELDLSTNYVVELTHDIFSKLRNLEILNLSKNNFTYLPENLLRYNKKLHTFSLYDNKKNMSTLPSKFFMNLTELEKLTLTRNGFFTLPEDLLWGCTSLRRVYLKLNYLRTLPVDIFRNLIKLTYLELSSNKIENLPDYIFRNTDQLQILDLSKNQITSISNHSFDGLNALEELNIEENRLSTISPHAFRFLKQLKIAKLSHNYLSLKQNFSKIGNENEMESPFHYCELLEELYLANNNIEEIFHDWTYRRFLRKLDLKHNNISHISITDILFEANNVLIDLTHNNIKNILTYNISLHKSNRKSIILVDNNPLHCGCEVYDFLRYIGETFYVDFFPIEESFMFPDIYIRPGNLTCQSPDKLKNVHVTDLKYESFMCVADADMCPKKCECLKRPKDSIFIFNCSFRNLISVPSGIIPADHSYQYELNFSGNRLTRMPDLKAMGFESVKKLILSHNKITEISLYGLSNTVQILELHNNSISRIFSDVLEFLNQSTNLTRLTLHENPWECDCNANDFLNFIQKKLVTLPDLEKVTCLKGSISEMIMTDICSSNITFMIMIIGIPISFTGLLIGIFILFYYKYQRQIKVWLFAHHWCLWFVTEEEMDKKKLYDAFVSYSQRDEDFVNELVSTLENSPRPFKLCLHYRDWLVGEWISVNIVNSVENSRRTIVVLSPNFLESVWGRMEFRTAHSQALSEGRARVILILYGDIGPINDLDPELQAYININTYIKWGDPRFWDKLRYALPHQPE